MAVGASALAVLHAVGRDVSAGTTHRRHAPVVVGRSGDTSPAPNIQARQLMAQRRALRQKRCAPRVPGSGDNNVAPSETTSSSSVSAEATEVPVNVAPVPTPDNNETPAPAPSDTNPAPSNGNSGGDTFTGELTYYDVGLGACGRQNGNGEMVAAASMLLYDGFNGYTGSDPNQNPICGKQAVIHFEGKEITVTIIDRCVGCAKYDLDLSPTAFSAVADQGRGRLQGATWHFL